MQIHNNNIKLQLLLGICCSAVASLPVCQTAHAQGKYLQADINSPDLLTPEGEINTRGVNLWKQQKTAILLGSTDYTAATKPNLDRWYREYVFRKLTLPEYASELPQIRSDLLRDLRGTPVPEIRRDLLAMTLSVMQQVSAGNFSPAARINAMLIIASLNSAPRSAQLAVPRPYAAALGTLRNAIVDAKQPDGVRLAAMSGLLRHIESRAVLKEDLPPNQRAVLVNDMLAIVNQADPPPKRTPAGHAWIRSRAIDILGALNDFGDAGVVFNRLNEVVGDEDAAPMMRCAAAKALGRFPYAGVSKDLSGEAATHMASLAADCCEQEIERLKRLLKIVEDRKVAKEGRVTGGGIAGGKDGMDGYGMPGEPGAAGGGAGATMDDPGAEEGYGSAMGGGPAGMMGGGNPFAAAKPDVVARYYQEVGRRRIRSQVMCVAAGLRGTSPSRNGIGSTAQSDESKIKVEKILSELDALLTDTQAADQGYDALLATYEKAVEELNTLGEGKADAADAASGDAAKTADAAAAADGDIPGAADGDIPGAADGGDIPGAAGGGADPAAGGGADPAAGGGADPAAGGAKGGDLPGGDIP